MPGDWEMPNSCVLKKKGPLAYAYFYLHGQIQEDAQETTGEFACDKYWGSELGGGGKGR